jgi:membrane-associated phospholipid phosphatase
MMLIATYIAMSLPATVALIISTVMSVNVMDYSISDQTFNHTVHSESIPFVATFIIELGLIPIFYLIHHRSQKKWHQLTIFILGGILCSFYGNAMVELTKKATGRLRPTAFHTQRGEALSFPSGHTMQAFVSLFYGFYVLPEGFVKTMTCIAYFIGAWAIAMTRLTENFHHEWDILGGILIAWIWCSILGQFTLYQLKKMSPSVSPTPSVEGLDV